MVLGFLPHQRRIVKKFVGMKAEELIYENRYHNTMCNGELQKLLKQYPDDALVVVEYCNIMDMTYYPDRNLITID